MNKILTGRPNFDKATEWGQYYVEELALKKAKEKGMPTVDLYANDATRAKYLENIKDSIFMTAVGHGSSNNFTGQGMQSVFWVNDEETKKAVKGKHINLLSCSTGKALCPWLAEQGAVAVHGYTNIYTFMTSDFPNHLATPFFISHHEVDNQLLNGGTHQEAHNACKAKYAQYIHDPNTPEICRAYLIKNMEGKMFAGDGTARITGATPPPERPAKPAQKIISVIVMPVSTEDTKLALVADKTKYNAGEKIKLNGSLAYISDSKPMPNRLIKIQLQGNEVGNILTDNSGLFSYDLIAPAVDQQTTVLIGGFFIGDL